MKNLPGYTDLFMSPVNGWISSWLQVPIPEGNILVGNSDGRAEPQEYKPFSSTLLEGFLWIGNEENIATATKQIDISNMPNLTEGKVWLGDSNNRPIESDFSPFSQTLKQDYIWVGDADNIAESSPALIDVRLDIINVRHKIDSFIDSTIILQTPNVNLPNSQALNALGGGILKSNTDGVISIAIPNADYMAGINSSTPNAVMVFADEQGKKVAMAGPVSNPVIVDGSGNLKAQGLMVRDTANTPTGFVAPSISDGSVYSLPELGGMITQVLAIRGLPSGGITPTFWMTIPEQLKRDPGDPLLPTIPIWIPGPNSEPIPVMEPTTVGEPNSVPVLKEPGSGETSDTPTKIDPETGDITTPGEVTADGGITTSGTVTGGGLNVAGAAIIGAGLAVAGGAAIAGGITGGLLSVGGATATAGGIAAAGSIIAGGLLAGKDLETENDATIGGNLNTNGNANVGGNFNLAGNMVTSGDLVTQGNINSGGSVASRKFKFEDSSDTSNNYIEAIAPTDLDHDYSIEWPDQEPPSSAVERFSIAGWYKSSLLPTLKLGYSQLVAESPLEKTSIIDPVTNIETITLSFNGSGGLDINQQYQQLCEMLINGPATITGFVSSEKNKEIKIKSSYYLNSGDSSSASLKLLNRTDNGYITKTQTQYGQNPDFLFQRTLNNNLTTLFSYDGTNNQFNFFNNIITGLATPINDTDAVNKIYVDSRTGSGTVTQINIGAGLQSSPSPITTTGTISIANTGVTAGSYKNLNATINSQGQVTAASNGLVTSPITINRTIPVWGDTVGNTLLATPVTMDANGNIVSPGDGTFADLNVSSGGFLTIGGNSSFSARFKASSSMTASYTMTLPTSNASGFFKNNGGGTLSWTTLTASDMSAVTSYRLDQFAAPTANVSFNSKKITNLADPTTAQDAATKNYVDSKGFYTDGDFILQLDSSGVAGLVIPERTNTSTPFVDSAGYLYVKSDGKLYYANRNGTVLIGGA